MDDVSLCIALLGLGLVLPSGDTMEDWGKMCALVSFWEHALHVRGFLDSRQTWNFVYSRFRRVAMDDLGLSWVEWRDAALAGGLASMLLAYRNGVSVSDILA